MLFVLSALFLAPNYLCESLQKLYFYKCFLLHYFLSLHFWSYIFIDVFLSVISVMCSSKLSVSRQIFLPGGLYFPSCYTNDNLLIHTRKHPSFNSNLIASALSGLCCLEVSFLFVLHNFLSMCNCYRGPIPGRKQKRNIIASMLTLYLRFRVSSVFLLKSYYR